ncbi:MAG: alpha-(1-_3)-arabinofuranosyltransferase family protein [Acidimicrobiales bacterium]
MERGGLARRERRALWGSGAAIALALVALEPGRILPETKLDVLIDPLGMLARALHAWDPSAGFGRLQNQAVGYLFPMGAFSAAVRSVGLPPWLVQRAWLALVVCASLWGAHRVARAIGIGGPAGRLVAAWTYALAPATLSIGLFQSAGQLPYALVPHVVAPLLAPRPGEGPRRTAARSTLWLAAMGGVNGASAIAVLPLVALWFLTRVPGSARRRLAAWWALGAVAATLWWIVPLLVSVRWGVRFTDYTESAATTTVTESATEVLRGTGNWLSYLETPAGSWLPGSWALAASPLAVAATVLLAAGGLVGLLRPSAPERRWLGACVLLGAAAMGAGWAGAGGGPAAHLVQDLLDGPLAPMRNVHKLAAVVRLPLALGLGHLVARLGRAVRSDERMPGGARLGPAVAATVLVGAALLPMVRTGAAAPGAFDDLPAAWPRAAAWLEAHQDGGRALLLPGSSFGEYRWGRPLDEPLASLLDAPWAVRDLVPLGGNGSTRLLDGIDAALATEALPESFSAVLGRMGITHLVVRNDLDLDRTGGPGPSTVRRQLTEAGLARAASFGPLQDPPDDGRRPPRPGLGGEASEAYRQIDVYEVPDAAPRAEVLDAAGTLVASGGPEGLLAIDPDLLADRPAVLAVDAGELPEDIEPVRVQTDSARRRDVQFGAVRDSSTATLEAGQRSPVTGEAPVDRWPGDEPTRLSDARLEGARSIEDSRRPGGGLSPEAQPFAAFDENPDTSWVPQRGRPGEWLEIQLDEPTEVATATIVLPSAAGRRLGAVTVETDRGHAEVELAGDRTTVELPPGPTGRVRVVVDRVDGDVELRPVGIAELELRTADGEPLEVRRPIVAAPLDGDRPADVVALARDRRDRLDVVRRDEDGRFDRLVSWAGGDAVASGTAVIGDGTRAAALLGRVGTRDAGAARLEASASSTSRDHPATAAVRAVDGDPATAWVSDAELGAPRLRLTWDRPVLVDSLVVTPLTEHVDQVAEVIVAGDEGAPGERHPLDASGRVELATPQRTRSLDLSFPGPHPDDDVAVARTVGIAEVEVPALAGRTPGLLPDDAPVALPCGDGPALRIDGDEIATRVDTTVGALRTGAAVPWEACDPVPLGAGRHRVEVARGALFAATLDLAPAAGVPAAPAPRGSTIERWGSVERRIDVEAGPTSILATTENLNAGWTATLDGRRLDPVRVDGWRQGWIVPAGAGGPVELRFAPDPIHRSGLALGALAVGALVAAALVGGRRDRARPAIALAADEARGQIACGLGAVACGALLAGPLVLVAVPLALVGRRRAPWLEVVAAGGLLGAGAVALAHPGAGLGSEVGTFSAAAQWLSAAALVAAGVRLATPTDASVRAAGRAGSTPSSPRPAVRPTP